MDVKLIIFKKDGSRKSFPLPSNVTVIGRRHDCDLCIPLMPVSRRHCQISLNKDTLKVRDLDSRNGTYLNGKQINNEAAIGAGDYLTIGPLTFLLQIDGQPKDIVPPEQAKPAKGPSKQTKPTPKAAQKEEDSFLGLKEADDMGEKDESDSFLAELKDL
jgi:pSer/pThr/pTyr-binding forkhead associated (FHA) protein